MTEENDKRIVSQRVSTGVTSLRSRLDILEKEISAFMEASMEKRVIMRLMPVLNQALTRYIDEKIHRAVRRDRVLQTFVPALSELTQIIRRTRQRSACWSDCGTTWWNALKARTRKS